MTSRKRIKIKLFPSDLVAAFWIGFCTCLILCAFLYYLAEGRTS